MKQYQDLIRYILENGEQKEDRTGVGTLSVFGTQTRYDLREGFPLCTLRKIPFGSIVKEMLWVLRGETNIRTLGAKFWNPWAREDGEIGPLYGKQLRKWDVIKLEDYSRPGPYSSSHYYLDQVGEIVNSLKTNPFSRRHLMTTFNPAQAEEGVLWPCHGIMVQFNVSESTFQEREVPKNYLDLHMAMRSNDCLIGEPFNIAGYSLLLMMIAKEVNMIPRYYIHTVSDHHIYLNHLEGAKEMLSRDPLLLPRVVIADKSIPYPGCPRDGFVLEPKDFKLEEYKYHEQIKFPIAV